MADSWEIINFGNLGHVGTADTDGDTLSDVLEFETGNNPNQRDSNNDGLEDWIGLRGYLTREVWNDLPGNKIADLTGNADFLKTPDLIEFFPGCDYLNPDPAANHYGQRLRGTVLAPVTGNYRFWIAGDASFELWLSSDARKFNKQKIAEVARDPLGEVIGTGYRRFDNFPSQRSQLIHLEAGKEYFIEILHKAGEGFGHVSVLWQYTDAATGTTTARDFIPATRLFSYKPDADDADDDYLPDSWEDANGLNKADNGSLPNSKDGACGDLDGDGLSNAAEWKAGTRANLADTDGDGLSDKAERDHYRTDPLVPNIIQPGPIVAVPLALFTASSIPWDHRPDGSTVAYERRGWIDYPITVAAGQEGIHEISLIGGADGASVRSTEKFPISFHLDGTRLGRHTMTCLIGQNTTVKQLTPWLKAGSYTLRVENHNVRAACNLLINSLTIQRLGGTSSNPSNPGTIPLWALDKLQGENHLTRLPAASRTSPACIEGVSPWPASILSSRSVDVPPTSTPIPAATGPDNIFYANIPLDPAAPTDLTITMQNGALVQPTPSHGRPPTSSRNTTPPLPSARATASCSRPIRARHPPAPSPCKVARASCPQPWSLVLSRVTQWRRTASCTGLVRILVASCDRGRGS